MIFADEEDETIYMWDADAVHVGLKGNRIVAENVYRLLFDDLVNAQTPSAATLE
jgi:hypothetical protein